MSMYTQLLGPARSPHKVGISVRQCLIGYAAAEAGSLCCLHYKGVSEESLRDVLIHVVIRMLDRNQGKCTY